MTFENQLKTLTALFVGALFFLVIFAVTTLSPQLASAQLLELNPIPFTLEAGQEITFSGKISFAGQPLAGQPIYIKDGITDVLIGTTTSDSNGEFFLTWIATPSDTTYLFYAEFVPTGSPEPVRSLPYEVMVSLPSSEETPVTSESEPEPSIETDTESLAEENLESGGEAIESSNEFVSVSEEFNPDYLLLIVIPVVAVVAYFIYRSKTRTTANTSVELRGGLE